MPKAPVQNGGIENKPNAFIKRLGEYKELIAIIVFFLGGLFWAFAYFATKAQLKQMHCISNANISIIQGKMDASNLSQLMVQNLQDTAQLEAKSPLTPAEQAKLGQLKETANEIGSKLADANNLTAEGLKKLTSGDCAPFE